MIRGRAREESVTAEHLQGLLVATLESAPHSAMHWARASVAEPRGCRGQDPAHPSDVLLDKPRAREADDWLVAGEGPDDVGGPADLRIDARQAVWLSAAWFAARPGRA